MASRRAVLRGSGYLKFCLFNSCKIGTHPINQSRETFGEYHHLFGELKCFPDKFKEYLRMDIRTFEILLASVKDEISKETTNWRRPISPEERLVVTLRYLITGSSFRPLAFEFRIGRSTISVIVKETCLAIWRGLQSKNMPPPDKEICVSSARKFHQKWNFPNCFGAIDGKHVRIQGPAHSGSLYHNYKRYFSIILQGVADPECKFLCVDEGAYGKQSDGGVFRNSDVYNCIQNNSFNCPVLSKLPQSENATPYVLVGDEAYPLMPTLMRPFPRQNLDANKKIFNYRLSRARRCVECAFGILTAKFQLLKRSIETDIDTAVIIIKAMCVLHNLIISEEGAGIDLANEESTQESIYENVSPAASRNSSRQALNVRDTFKNYFVSQEEQVPWQYFI